MGETEGRGRGRLRQTGQVSLGAQVFSRVRAEGMGHSKSSIVEKSRYEKMGRNDRAGWTHTASPPPVDRREQNWPEVPSKQSMSMLEATHIQGCEE
jgi:hypothetical protein